MRYPICGHENRGRRKFCAQCGAAPVLACPSCGAANEPSDRFCGQCGQALGGGGPSQPQEEDVDATLVNGLKRLVTEVGRDGFLIASVGPVYYVQFCGGSGERKIHMEAVGNAYLPKELQLDRAKEEQLHSLGFELVDRDGRATPVRPKRPVLGNFEREFDVPDEASIEELARLARRILIEVYGCSSEAEIELRTD